MKIIIPLIIFYLIVTSVHAQITDSIIDVRDGQIYKVVKIGKQWWMQENLNVGIRIDSSQNPTNNGIIEKYCYYDNDSLCNIYGGLYYWYEMTDYSPSDIGNREITQGICPVGWHLSIGDEWYELRGFLGGENVAGGKMKETGIAHWKSPNTGATNESGFTALPGGGGNRSINGNFDGIGEVGGWWSSERMGSVEQPDVVNYYMNYNSGILCWYWIPLDVLMETSYSVRCLRDSCQFGYLTISDKNLKSVSELNFYGYNISEKLIIINSGTGKTVTISSIYNNNPVFTLDCSPVVLSPGDSVHFTITFDPNIKNIYQDTLFIKSDDPYNPLIPIPLNGTSPPEISFTDRSNISCYGFKNGSATVTPVLGTPPYHFQWNDQDYTTDSTVNSLSPNIIYRITVTDALGWTVKDSIILSEPAPLTVHSDYSDSICFNSSNGFIQLNTSGGTPPYNYLWSHGDNSQNISDLTAGDYTAKITDNNECENNQSFTINEILPYNSEKICIVTVDLTSEKNIIIWEKTPNKRIGTYNIYRESDIGQFEKIGSKSAEELSIFKDEKADPESRSYLYKITITDTCGNESDLDSVPYHWPSFLQYVSSVGGINLSWTDYRIEGIDNIGDYLTKYVIYRGSDSTGLVEYQEVGRQLNFTDTDPDALIRRYYYRVASIFKDTCYPASGNKAGTGPYSQSMSNIEDNRLKVGIGENFMNHSSVRIIPNPFSNKAIIQFPNSMGYSYDLVITDLTGKVVRFVGKITENSYELNKDVLPAGLYLIELRGPNIYRGKIIIE
jgi:uncharacterized protein (TIGR02145 family)